MQTPSLLYSKHRIQASNLIWGTSVRLLCGRRPLDTGGSGVVLEIVGARTIQVGHIDRRAKICTGMRIHRKLYPILCQGLQLDSGIVKPQRKLHPLMCQGLECMPVSSEKSGTFDQHCRRLSEHTMLA